MDSKTVVQNALRARARKAVNAVSENAGSGIGTKIGQWSSILTRIHLEMKQFMDDPSVDRSVLRSSMNLIRQASSQIDHVVPF